MKTVKTEETGERYFFSKLSVQSTPVDPPFFQALVCNQIDKGSSLLNKQTYVPTACGFCL